MSKTAQQFEYRPAALRKRYDNFIGGKWVAPLKGRYFADTSPLNQMELAQVARSSAEDVELALDAAHKARHAWAGTAPAERARLLNRIADRIEENLPFIANVETVDNGKPIRETLNADVPLAADHFRYFAGCIRAEEGAISEIDHDTIAYHFKEPMGVVGQIIPWNFPLLMAAWKLAPTLVAGMRRHQAGVRYAVESGRVDGSDWRHPAGRRPQCRVRPRI
jgi:aldehyde dehydrogenase